MKHKPSPNSSAGGSRTDPQAADPPFAARTMSPTENDNGKESQPTASNPGLTSTSVHSDDYMNLQFYGNYTSHQDFFRIRHDIAPREDLDPWSPGSDESNLLEAASNWFGTCFGCNPGNDELPTREQSTNTEKSEDFLHDDESSGQPNTKPKKCHPDKA